MSYINNSSASDGAASLKKQKKNIYIVALFQCHILAEKSSVDILTMTCDLAKNNHSLFTDLDLAYISEGLTRLFTC